MSKQSIIRFTAIASFLVASSASVIASAETTATRAGTQSTLKRANDDVLRQLRPSGLKQHGQNMSRIANRGYVDFMATIKAPGHRR
jgi:hypothetical protein